MKTYGWFKDIYEKTRGSFDFKLMNLELEVGEKILAIMEEKSISRSKLADLMGVSKAAVSKLLNNPQNLTLKTLLKVSLALGCDIDIMIDGRRVKPACVGCVEEKISVICRYDLSNREMTRAPIRIPDDYELPVYVAFRG